MVELSPNDEVRKQRRPSVCSAIDNLAPQPNGITLSPYSVVGDSNNTRRRNSYAATTNTSESDASMSTVGLMAHGSAYGSSHFLDPRTAASASFRRRLPPTPNFMNSAAPSSLGQRIATTLIPDEIQNFNRRSSSPRMLPLTPPEMLRQGCCLSSTPLERRRSASTRRRQLPPEPPESQCSLAQGPHLSAAIPQQYNDNPGAKELNVSNSNLYRSSSTRENTTRHSPHFPTPELHQPPTNQLFLNQQESNFLRHNVKIIENHSYERDNNGVSNEPPTVPVTHTPTKKSIRAISTSKGDHPRIELQTSNELPTLTVPASAPPSPREDSDEIGGLLKDSLHNSFQQPRKYSSDAASSIASLSLVRNGSGSMAHLLEQQHILRREFTSSASPDSAFSMTNLSHRSQSNSSSPSIEQINCSTNNNQAMSRSGSEAEDPTIHGLDPSLYTAGSALTHSNHSEINGHSPVPTTSVGIGEENIQPRGLGLIHCIFQYFPTRKRLRVGVLKVERLAGELKPELEIQPFCRVSLLPGKKQQQQGVVKRGRDAVFNQEFFFDNMSAEEIKTKQVKIEICHQSSQKLQKDLDIGEIRISLKELNQKELTQKKEIRVVEELKIFPTNKKLGKITLTSCIEKDAKRLTINLIKVEDLPKWGIIGAPDICIRIKMQQGSGQEVVKNSRVIKNSTSAVYKEAIMFLVSTKEADILRTRITISVHDTSRTVTGNDVIGYVFLGELAVDRSEIDQWKNCSTNWGKEYKGVHYLKSSHAPELYVTNSDDCDCE